MVKAKQRSLDHINHSEEVEAKQRPPAKEDTAHKAEKQMQEKQDRFKRYPAVPKTIDCINPKEDVKVRIVGKIVEKDEDSSSIVVDDGKETISVIITSDSLLSSLVIGRTVCVFGQILPIGDEFELKAELVQDMKGFDLKLFRRVISTLKNE